MSSALRMSWLKKCRYRLEWVAMKSATWLIPLLSRRGVAVVARVCGKLAFVLDRGGRETALENLRIVFGEEKSPQECEAIARASYQNFARTFIDLFWGPQLSRENYEQYVTFEIEDPEELERAVESGILWMTPHYGNFEWVSLLWGFKGQELLIVAKDFKNPLLTEIFTSLRSHSGHQVIPSERAMIRLLRKLRQKGQAAFLPDLTVKPDQAATVIDCFGLKTSVTVLHSFLYQRTKIPVIPALCLPNEDGTYRMKLMKSVAIPEDASMQDISQLCWDAFEPFIREQPEGWLWMYKHWRYRPKDAPEESYPNYSNVSGKFNKLMRSLEK